MVQLRRLLQNEAIPSRRLLEAIHERSLPLRSEKGLDPLMDAIGDARYVLLGEASHGTSDYYRWRARISQRLIAEQGFSFIAVEGDWPDCYQVNRFVKDLDDAKQSARDVLQTFVRWPSWMWANEEVADLLTWLREFNRNRPEVRKIGFYGLDVYSLWNSLYAVMSYLRRSHPEALPAAWRAYRCFEPYAEDVQDYARAAQFVPDSCESEVVELLRKLRHRTSAHPEDNEADFDAEQNAIVLKNAETYYRTMVRGGAASWNVRDRHMTETLERLMQHHGGRAKGIVWAHNTHIGNARFTDMVDGGEINLGQLVREQHAQDSVVLVGFGCYRGSVIAGRRWDAPMQPMNVPPARAGSWEDVLHGLEPRDKLLLFTEPPTPEMLEPRGHRAIGVVYRPEYESRGNYVPTVLARRYDAFLFLDSTEALHPLGGSGVPVAGEAPETFPSGV